MNDMHWKELDTKSRTNIPVDEAKARILDEAKKELPVVQREADGGVRPFETVQYQPIQGVGIFEAEFGVKKEDVIFHFWPWGYHASERAGESRRPTFRKGFDQELKKAVEGEFRNHRAEVFEDPDVGAWFVRVIGGANFQFHRQMCINAVTSLYKALGGEV